MKQRYSAKYSSMSHKAYNLDVWSARIKNLQSRSTRHRAHRDYLCRLGTKRNIDTFPLYAIANMMCSMPYSHTSATHLPIGRLRNRRHLSFSQTSSNVHTNPPLILTQQPSQDLPNHQPQPQPRAPNLSPTQASRAISPSIPQARHTTQPGLQQNRQHARIHRLCRPYPPHAHPTPMNVVARQVPAPNRRANANPSRLAKSRKRPRRLLGRPRS